MNPGDYITLEAAAALIPGVTAGTLKRRAREGMLAVYRPGKAYLTTVADVRRMIDACRVRRKDQGCISGPIEMTVGPARGLSGTVIASAALDSELELLSQSAKKR